MTTETLSIKFASAANQEARLHRLEAFCGELVREGVAQTVQVQPIFPGHRDPLRASMFTVIVNGAARDILTRFENLGDVEYAHVAKGRRALSAV